MALRKALRQDWSPQAVGDEGWTWKGWGGGAVGLNVHSSGAIISPLVLLEEFQSPHYHFIWFQSTHLPPPPPTHKNGSHRGLWTFQENYPRTHYFPFWKKRKPFVFPQAQLQSARTQASNFYSILYQNPPQRGLLQPQSSAAAFRPSFQGGWNESKHLGTTINDLSSQTGKKHLWLRCRKHL